MNGYPDRRMRRLRRTASIRALRRETRLSADDFIYPLFIVERGDQAGPVSSMPGVSRLRIDDLDREVEGILAAGLRSVLLFGLPAKKDATGSTGCCDDNIVSLATARIKKLTDRLVVMTDVCLCEYTDHGHCGIVCEGAIDNDETLAALSKMAVAHARAGADFVAPRGMMDGMVGAIREGLDDAGLLDTGILSYAVKYASSFYGPFREAADSKPAFGDRRSYQMDPANAREALAETKLDIDEGADIIMVKPALPYLDVVQRVRDAFPEVPLAAYQVSGEYSMIKAAAKNGWLNERDVVLEARTGIKRAGADLIITYFAKEAAGWLRT